MWLTHRKIFLIQERRKKKKNFQLNIGGSDEKDLEKAKKRSLGKQEPEESSDEDYEGIEEEEAGNQASEQEQKFF